MSTEAGSASRRRCLLADDHPAVLAAVTKVLEGHGLEVLTAVDGRAAVDVAAAEQPEVAVVDLCMPWLQGVELIEALRAAAPETALVIYTAFADSRIAWQALEAGAAAVVLKDAPLADLTRALETVRAGDSYLDPTLGTAPDPRTDLTPRERDVLGLVSQGLRHEDVAQRLGISCETVRTHLSKASARLGAVTRTQAVAKAVRAGLI